MKAFLIILLCHGFSLGPATMFQPSDYLAKCKAVEWEEDCNYSVAALSKQVPKGDPWGDINHTQLAKKETGDLGSETKSGPANLASYKCDGDPWDRDLHKPLTKHRR